MDKKEKKTVGLAEKLGFMSFSTSTNIVFNFKSTYYKYFLTSILLIDPVAASNMALIGTVWDIVNDPLIGVWANNVRFKSGERVRLSVKETVNLANLFLIEPLGKLFLGTILDFRIDVNPDFFQHIKQDGQIIAQADDRNGIGHDVERTNHIAKSTNYNGFVLGTDLIALKSIKQNKRSIYQFGSSALGYA